MTTIRRLFTACCLVFIAVGLVACEEQGPVGSNQQSEPDNQDVTKKTSHESRLKSLGLPSDFKSDVNTIDLSSGRAKATTQDLQLEEEKLQARAPSGDRIGSYETISPVRTSTGEAALPESGVRSDAKSLSQIDLNSTITKDNTAPSVEGTRSLQKSSGSFDAYIGSYVYFWPYFYDWATLGSYTITSENINYLDVFGSSSVNFIYRSYGFDYQYDGSYAAVSSTFDRSNFSGWTYYSQDGDHYLQYECGYGGQTCDLQEATSAWAVEYE